MEAASCAHVFPSLPCILLCLRAVAAAAAGAAGSRTAIWPSHAHQLPPMAVSRHKALSSGGPSIRGLGMHSRSMPCHACGGQHVSQCYASLARLADRRTLWQRVAGRRQGARPLEDLQNRAAWGAAASRCPAPQRARRIRATPPTSLMMAFLTGGLRGP